MAKLRLQAQSDAEAARQAKKRADEAVEKASESARQEARRIIEDARTTTDQVFQELKEMKKKQKKAEDWQAANEQRTAVRRSLNEAEGRLGAKKEEEEVLPPTRPAVKGDTVELLSLHTRATVLDVKKDGTLQLQAGILKVNAKQEEVRVVESPKTTTAKQAKKLVSQASSSFRVRAVSTELDIRGMMTDEAELTVDRFIDSAALAHLSSVTIIHGKGTGALRAAVHRRLKGNRAVKSYRLGRYGEGETGVTVVELK
jgi:DNA mismatch repair protein MutS2